MLTMYVRPSGLEPLTYSLEGCCSIRLSYGRISQQNVMNMFFRRGDSPPLADRTATFPISSGRPISPEFKQLFNRFLNYSVGETVRLWRIELAAFPISSGRPISPDFKQLFERFLNYSVGETVRLWRIELAAFPI